MALLLGFCGAALGAELPEDGVRPVAQGLHLWLDPSADGYRGITEIDLDVVAGGVDRFHLHGKGLDLDSVELEGPPGAKLGSPDSGGSGIRYDFVGDRISVSTPVPLEPGPHRLRIAFRGTYRTDGLGLFRIEVDGRPYLFTDFIPDDARSAFPCWDEPDFKIPWTVRLTAPAGNVVLGNGPVVGEATHPEGTTRILAPTPPLPAYLMAVAVGPFDTVPIRGLRVPGRVVTVRGRSGAEAVAKEIPPLLEALERWFESPLPFAKLDLVAVPELWPSAIENPGLVVFDEDQFLFGADGGSGEQRRRRAKLIAHEIAHMWFGNLVTLEWWNDLWLNESFAEWLAVKVVDARRPDLGLGMETVADAQAMMVEDAVASSRAVRYAVDEPGVLYPAGSVAYRKGRAVLDMFEAWIGPERFRRGVIDYLERHAGGNATADDLWRALDGRAPPQERLGAGTDGDPGVGVGEAMASFLDQPGLPLVRGEVRAGGLRLRQERYRRLGVDLEALTWNVPVGLAWPAADGLRRRMVMLGAGGLELPWKDFGPQGSGGPGARPDWIMLDAGGRGYYRWSVGGEGFGALVDNALDDLDRLEVAAFLGNARALLDAGELSGGAFLDLLGGLLKRRDPGVGGAALGALAEVEAAFVAPGWEEVYGRWLRRSLAPTVASVGLLPGESVPGAEVDGAAASERGLLRPQLWRWLGRQGQDPGVRRRARGIADAWLSGAPLPGDLDPATLQAILEVAAAGGDLDLFHTFRRRLEATDGPAARAMLLKVLGAFEDPGVRDAVLRYVVEGPLSAEESLRLPFGLAHDAAGRDQLYAWFEASSEVVLERLPPQLVPMLPVFARGCSAERLDAARRFFSAPERRHPGVPQQLAMVAEQAETCLALRRREGASAREFLAREGAGVPRQPAGGSTSVPSPGLEDSASFASPASLR
ncbi:MAG: M1 family aminopeptidase [Acidobacteriota bacterium]